MTVGPKIISDEAEYDAALDLIDSLMDASPGSSDEDQLKVWVLLVQEYEERCYPIDLPDPVDAIKFRMEQGGLTQKDMRAYLGSPSKVSEVLNRKRPLSLSMIRRLHRGLGIPAEVLIRELPDGGSHSPNSRPASLAAREDQAEYETDAARSADVQRNPL